MEQSSARFDPAAAEQTAWLDCAVGLLQRMVRIPSPSRSEGAVADLLEGFLKTEGVEVHRVKNNLWALAANFDPTKPTLMLNSHIDTVKPAASYSFDPFSAHIADGRLYGLGSNDAGASVVSLIITFLRLQREPLAVNLLLAISAEEEVSGENGMRALIPAIKAEGISIDMGIIGEPTCLQPAIAERGLVVLDCIAHGVSGHAARNEGVNTIYLAMKDIESLRTLQFDKVSNVLGPIKISVTQIEAGRQHNVVPDECRFVADVRTTDAYTNEQTVELIRQAITSEATPRSTRIRASVISLDHPLVRAAVALGGKPFVSPTTSDMALLPDIPTLKIGPGDSARSHTADEYINISEIQEAITFYSKMIKEELTPSNSL